MIRDDDHVDGDIDGKRMSLGGGLGEDYVGASELERSPGRVEIDSNTRD